MSQSGKSSKHSFKGMERSEQLVYQELKFANYEDLFEWADEATIIDYIINEAKEVQASKQNDLAELKRESAGLQDTINMLEEHARQLDQKADECEARQDAARKQLDKIAK